jgi:hypothetical protein
VNVRDPGYNRPMASLALTFTIGAALAAVSRTAVAEDASGTASYQAKLEFDAALLKEMKQAR